MQSGQVRLAVVMDPIGAIKPAKDTTLAMLLAAQRRGWRVEYLELKDLWLRDGVAWGRSRPVAVRDDNADWYTLGGAADCRLADFDAILMRKDPPFDTEYIYATYILERAEIGGALVVNRPAGSARHEREGLHGLVPGVLRADADHARHARDARLPARARADRLQAAARHGRQVDLRRRDRRQERRRDLRDPDRVRNAVRDRAALHPRDRPDRRLPGDPGGRRTCALRARAHTLGVRSSRQPRRGGEGCRPAARRAGPLARFAASVPRCASAGCCSSGSTSSAATSPRST